jgi:hypothetical protein
MRQLASWPAAVGFGAQDILDNTGHLRNLVLKLDPQGGAVAPGDAAGELAEPAELDAHVRVGLDRLAHADLGTAHRDVEHLAVNLFVPGNQLRGTKCGVTRVLLPIN